MGGKLVRVEDCEAAVRGVRALSMQAWSLARFYICERMVRTIV